MLEIRGSQCPIGTKLSPLAVLIFMKFGPVGPELWTIEYCVLATAGILIYLYTYNLKLYIVLWIIPLRGHAAFGNYRCS